MATEDKQQLKWEGKVTAEVNDATAGQVWPLLEDFCNLHKWLPRIDTCCHVEGVYGEPGLIRYCASTVPSPSDDGDTKIVNRWCKEKLLAMDPTNKSLSYEILDNNLGFKYYEAKLKVLPTDKEGKHGCQIEWSFMADPIDGYTCAALRAYLESSLQGMVEKMEKALQQS